MIEPQAGPAAYKTYQIAAPVRTHFQQITCREAECPGFRLGFKTVVPSDSPQAAYIRARSGRSFTEHSAGGGLTEFRFPAGQQCFRSADHFRSLEREPFYVVRDGDYRGNPYGTRPVQRRAVEWVDDFATHQQGIADRIREG